MSQLMESLFSILESVPPQKAERQAVKAADKAVRAAQEHLTYQELEDLWDAIANIEYASDLDSFILGFRMGVQLTLEGLRPVYPEDQPSLQK